MRQSDHFSTNESFLPWQHGIERDLWGNLTLGPSLTIFDGPRENTLKMSLQTWRMTMRCTLDITLDMRALTSSPQRSQKFSEFSLFKESPNWILTLKFFHFSEFSLSRGFFKWFSVVRIYWTRKRRNFSKISPLISFIAKNFGRKMPLRATLGLLCAKTVSVLKQEIEF